MKTQKQFTENMKLMFQKHVTAASKTQSSGTYMSTTDEKYSNDASQQEGYDSDIHENIPCASRKRKRVKQGGQNSQDRATLHPSNSDVT